MSGPNISVLVVEDDHFQRFAVVSAMSGAGFEVCEAQNSEEAIELLNHNPGINALFTDVEMPGDMNGLELASAVHDRWPAIKIVIASGRANIGKIDIPIGSYFFSKPYNSRNVALMLRDMLAAA